MKNLGSNLGTWSACSCLTCSFGSLTWIQTAVVALTKSQDHDGSDYTGPAVYSDRLLAPVGMAHLALPCSSSCGTLQPQTICLVQCILKHLCPTSFPLLLCFSHPELGMPALLPDFKNPCTYCRLYEPLYILQPHRTTSFLESPPNIPTLSCRKSLLWYCSKSYTHFIFFSSSKYLLDICIFI